MSEHSPKDQVSLEDLKQALERVPANPRFIAGCPVEYDDLYRYEFQRAEAWRMAFEWLASWERRVMLDADYDAGTALIREKLS